MNEAFAIQGYSNTNQLLCVVDGADIYQADYLGKTPPPIRWRGTTATSPDDDKGPHHQVGLFPCAIRVHFCRLFCLRTVSVGDGKPDKAKQQTIGK